jgi:hypothetical protein
MVCRRSWPTASLGGAAILLIAAGLGLGGIFLQVNLTVVFPLGGVNLPGGNFSFGSTLVWVVSSGTRLAWASSLSKKKIGAAQMEG